MQSGSYLDVVIEEETIADGRRQNMLVCKRNQLALHGRICRTQNAHTVERSNLIDQRQEVFPRVHRLWSM